MGANYGQFATALFKAGYSGSILLLKPIPEAYENLLSKAETSGKNWKVGPCVAISDHDGSASLNAAVASSVSSLLLPTAQLLHDLPRARIESVINVSVRKLDSLMGELIHLDDTSFLKVDVQGAERLVLAGAEEFLKRAAGVMIEVSLVPLYEGESYASEMLEGLLAKGFEIWDINRGYMSPKTARLQQLDVVLFKKRPGTTA
ncbi:MAG: FkbM family methyltransferase [Pseudomonadota bacterium]